MLLGEDHVVKEHMQIVQTVRKQTVGLAVCNFDCARNEKNHVPLIDNLNSTIPYTSVRLILGTHDAAMMTYQRYSPSNLPYKTFFLIAEILFILAWDLMYPHLSPIPLLIFL